MKEHRPFLSRKRDCLFIQMYSIFVIVIPCDEWGMLQLVYSNRKLKAAKLRGTLDDVSFSCSAGVVYDVL